MIEFQTVVPTSLPLDPSKRVNYVQGLVLGVDEFVQEHAYVEGKHRLHNRLLHGYGTAAGLRIEVSAPGAADPQLSVYPGWAVDQAGREIRVRDKMCVQLNEWLKRHRSRLEASGFRAGDTIPLCVALCYRECETDQVPIPGEPCRTQADVDQPSRVADSFELKLCLDERYKLTSMPGGDDLCCCSSSQPEEDAARALGELLGRIQVIDGAAAYVVSLVTEIRALQNAAGTTSAPATAPIYLRPADAADILREAMRVWVTEVRLALLEAEKGPVCDQRDRCVLLGDLALPLGAAWIVGGALTVDEMRRPYLLDTRLIQEWLLSERIGDASAGGGGGGGGPVVFPPGVGDVSGTYPNLQVVGLRGSTVNVPVAGQFLRYDGVAWATAPIPAPVIPPLQPGAVDVDGTYPDLTVVGLQRRTVANTAPSTGQALGWDSAAKEWTPVFDVRASSAYAIVAAGTFDANGMWVAPPAQYNNFAAAREQPGGTDYLLTFDEYRQPGPRGLSGYVVKGTVQSDWKPRPNVSPPSFVVVQFIDAGVRVRVCGTGNAPLQDGDRFMVEISRVGA